MLLTVKKQIEETVEFKTPAYYKDPYGHHFINEGGQLITVRTGLISIWGPGQTFYESSIEQALKEGRPCTKEDFHKAFAEVSAKLALAADAVEF